MMFSRLFQLATSLGIVQTSCWSDQESILAFIFMFIGCLFIYLFIYLLALSHHPLYVCIAFYVTFYRFHISCIWAAAVPVILLIGWELHEVKGPLPRLETYRTDGCSCRIPHPVVRVRRHEVPNSDEIRLTVLSPYTLLCR